MSNHPIHQKELNCSYDHNISHIPLERHSSDSSSNKEFTLRDILERWVGSEETLRTVMIAKAEEDKLKQEMVRLDIKKVENEILVNALRGGIQPNAIPMIFSGQQSNSSSLTLSQSYPLSSTQSTQYQSHALGSSDVSISALCTGSQESNLSNQCTSQHHPQINISNTLDSFSTDSPCQKNTKYPLILTKNTAESTSNQNHALNSNTSSLPSLFFHYWVPPGESINSMSTTNNEGSESTASPQSNILNSHEKEPCSFSPSKKKRISQPQPQQPMLPSFGNPILPPLSRRSPRHHLRHRSETSVLQSKFFDIPQNKQKNPPITNENNFQDTKIFVDKPLEFNKEKKYKDDRIFGI
ncbi:hypothetical protein PCK1_001810 [Pneumocystis canis]|nr:hypothetical protein PCK1_001810 [Pneumocystis canis]